MSADDLYPPLPYGDWVETRDTLHLFLQIIGKVRMKAHPKLNHWWHVTLYPDTRGLTTGRIPYKGRSFQIDYDMVDHVVQVTTNDGGNKGLCRAGQDRGAVLSRPVRRTCDAWHRCDHCCQALRQQVQRRPSRRPWRTDL
jgi:hypothetical protein